MRTHGGRLVVSLLVLSSCGGGGNDQGVEENATGLATTIVESVSDSLPTDQVATGDTGVEAETTVPEPSSAEFALESLPIDLAGDVWAWPTDVGSWPARLFPPIHVFGKEYEGKIESTLMFDMVKTGTQVLSPITGRVVDVREQPESCDVEIYIGSETFEQVVSLDHVVATVAIGDNVEAGQVVGTVPQWQCTEQFGRFELMLVREDNGMMQAYCPADFWSEELAPLATTAITDVMQRWNTHAAGAASVYSDSELASGICASPTAPA